MLIYIKLAVRNVHKRIRSIWLNGAGIALTAIAIIIILSLSRGIENQIVRRNIAFETGAVSIKIKKELSSYEHKISGDSLYHQLTSLLEGHSEVKGYQPRISAYNALLYFAEGNQRIKVEGITANDIPLLTEVISMLEGNSIGEQPCNGILISQALAEESKVSMGDECNIVIQSADGTINMQDFIVSGIFLNNSYSNKYSVYTLYEQAKELYHTNLPTTLLIDIYNLDKAGEVEKYLTSRIDHPDIEVGTWQDTLGAAQTLSGINRLGMLGMAFFLALISFVGIWAMEVESINTRKREVGTLLAFGFTRPSVKKIFLLESAYTALLFLLAGLFVILPTILLIHFMDGIYLGTSASFAFGSSVIKPELKSVDIAITSSVVLVYPLIATWLSLQIMNKTRIINLLNN